MNELEIKSICKKYGIKNYTINPDGSIDVDGSVNLSYQKLTKLPLNFNRVTGNFYCHNNRLTSLEGGPKEVGEYFSCHDNRLTSLEGGPKEVGVYFFCYNNPLPKTIIDDPKVWIKSYYRDQQINKILND